MDNLVRHMDWAQLKHEYDVDAQRLAPWLTTAPFGGAWVVVRPHTRSFPHVNEPADEEELFICISGEAEVCIGEQLVNVKKGDLVFFPAGMWHYIENKGDEDFHLYCIWWNQNLVNEYQLRHVKHEGLQKPSLEPCIE